LTCDLTISCSLNWTPGLELIILIYLRPPIRQYYIITHKNNKSETVDTAVLIITNRGRFLVHVCHIVILDSFARCIKNGLLFFDYFIKIIFGRLVFERRKSAPKPDSTDRIIERRRSYYANLTYFMGHIRRVLLEIVMAYDQRNKIKIITIIMFWCH